MSQRQATVNHCDICTHEWIPKPGVLYTHCTSSRCRSRKWNSASCALVTASAVTKVTLPEPEVIRPSMEHLRDICAGITPTMQPLREVLDAMRPPIPGPPMSQMPCAYTEYDEQTGETYACGLPVHPARVKHTRGRRL